VHNTRYDILAYNRTYAQMMCDLDALPPEDLNCIWLAFTNEQWRAALTHREETLRQMAAKYRAAMAEHLAEPVWKTLLARLLDASAEFREMWERHEVVGGTEAKSKSFFNDRVGLLNLEQTNLWLGPSSGPWVVSYVPLDEETGQRLERLQALVPAGV
jgi:hypothetical protein